MSKDLYDLAEEIGIDADNSWVRIAFNQLLGSIYHSKMPENEEDLLIEKLASILFEKLGIKEDELDWQKVEDWHYKEAYNLVSYDYYIDFNEAKKIICKAKVSPDYDWEDISSSVMDIKKINEKMIEAFNEFIEDYRKMDGKTLDEFIEKGIYTDFRETKKTV
jgi:hypothetical protein